MGSFNIWHTHALGKDLSVHTKTSNPVAYTLISDPFHPASFVVVWKLSLYLFIWFLLKNNNIMIFIKFNCLGPIQLRLWWLVWQCVNYRSLVWKPLVCDAVVRLKSSCRKRSGSPRLTKTVFVRLTDNLWHSPITRACIC